MANSDKNIRITGNKNTATGIFPKIVFTGAAAGSSIITLEVLDDNTLSFTSNEGQVFSLDSNLSVGTIWSVNDISGVPLLRASAGATIGIAEFSGNVGVGESNPLSKLSVRGAFGIGSTTTTNYSVFQFPSAGSGQAYILPSAYPGAGTSVLQSDTSGNLTWVGMSAGSPGGSGTVYAGTAGSVAYYPASGTGVTGTSLIQIASSGTAVSFYSHIDAKTGNDLRLWNSGDTFYTAFQAGNNSASYNLILPTAPVGVGYSVMLVDTSGNMYFVPAEGGLAYTSPTGNRPVLRQRQNHHIWFAAGYTPPAAGPDSVIYQIPDLYIDGTSDVTYQLEAFYIRVETPSASPSRIQVEKSSTRTGAFTLAATGSSLVGGLGLTISGAGIYITNVTTFGSGILVTSGDLLRLNWTLLNATHANFSVQLTLAEI